MMPPSGRPWNCTCSVTRLVGGVQVHDDGCPADPPHRALSVAADGERQTFGTRQSGGAAPNRHGFAIVNPDTARKWLVHAIVAQDRLPLTVCGVFVIRGKELDDRFGEALIDGRFDVIEPLLAERQNAIAGMVHAGALTSGIEISPSRLVIGGRRDPRVLLVLFYNGTSMPVDVPILSVRCSRYRSKP